MSETFSIQATQKFNLPYRKKQAAGSKLKRIQALIQEDEKDDLYSQNQSAKGGKKPKYNWTVLENKRYIKFLEQSGHLFSLSRNERKQKKVNLQMSKKVKTRSPTQCHTHHQKMITRHGDIDGIITHFENLFSIKDHDVTCKSKERQPQTQNEKQLGVDDSMMKSPSQLLAIETLMASNNLVFLERDGEEYEYNIDRNPDDLQIWINF